MEKKRKKSGCLIYKHLSVLRNKQNHEKMCLWAFVTFSDTNQSALLPSIARACKQDLATARIHRIWENTHLGAMTMLY